MKYLGFIDCICVGVLLGSIFSIASALHHIAVALDKIAGIG